MHRDYICETGVIVETTATLLVAMQVYKSLTVGVRVQSIPGEEVVMILQYVSVTVGVYVAS